jgi:hypothetical protein
MFCEWPSSPDEKRSFDKGELELVTLGGVTFGRATLQPGWKWSTCVKPIVNTEGCQASHLQGLRRILRVPLRNPQVALMAAAQKATKGF